MKKLALTLFTAAALTAAGSAIARHAHAEGCPEDTNEGERKQGKFHIEYVNGKPITVIDTVVSVCGKVPRPSVVYVLTAKNIDYEWEGLIRDGMPATIGQSTRNTFSIPIEGLPLEFTLVALDENRYSLRFLP